MWFTDDITDQKNPTKTLFVYPLAQRPGRQRKGMNRNEPVHYLWTKKRQEQIQPEKYRDLSHFPGLMAASTAKKNHLCSQGTEQVSESTARPTRKARGTGWKEVVPPDMQQDQRAMPGASGGGVSYRWDRVPRLEGTARSNTSRLAAKEGRTN